jgi:hypothetical protein
MIIDQKHSQAALGGTGRAVALGLMRPRRRVRQLAASGAKRVPSVCTLKLSGQPGVGTRQRPASRCGRSKPLKAATVRWYRLGQANGQIRQKYRCCPGCAGADLSHMRACPGADLDTRQPALAPHLVTHLVAPAESPGSEGEALEGRLGEKADFGLGDACGSWQQPAGWEASWDGIGGAGGGSVLCRAAAPNVLQQPRLSAGPALARARGWGAEATSYLRSSSALCAAAAAKSRHPLSNRRQPRPRAAHGRPVCTAAWCSARLKQLPDTIGQLTALSSLDLDHCERL